MRQTSHGTRMLQCKMRIRHQHVKKWHALKKIAHLNPIGAYARGAQRRTTGPATNPNYGVGTVEYTRSRGGYGITLECGQHGDPQAVQVARLAILQTLALLGLAALPLQPMPAGREILRLVDVTDLEHPCDRFSRDWDSFDAVKAGELIGTRHSGEPVCAPDDGFVVFPNPQAEVGGEWFYFARRGQSVNP